MAYNQAFCKRLRLFRYPSVIEVSKQALATSVDTRSISLDYFSGARAVNHQVVTDWALSLGDVSFYEEMSFCMTAAIGAANFLCYPHFTTCF